MTIFTVAVKYLRARTVASILTALSVALAVSLVIASVLLTRGIKEGFVEGTTDYNLVVGAKGSPTQLVLSVVFRMDVATPNILTRTFRRLQEDPRVDAAVPLALGRSEEHTSELQSHSDLVCRLLLEKKKTKHSTGKSCVPIRPSDKLT